MACRTLSALLLACILAGCRQGVELKISRVAQGAVRLDVMSPSPDFRACIDNASIYPAGHPDMPVWELGRTEPARCIHAVLVGPAAPGFAQRVSGQGVRAGTRYCAAVNGPGFGARRSFVMQKQSLTDENARQGDC